MRRAQTPGVDSILFFLLLLCVSKTEIRSIEIEKKKENSMEVQKKEKIQSTEYNK